MKGKFYETGSRLGHVRRGIWVTSRQREVLGEINDYIVRHSYAPSIQELGKMLGIGSTHGVVDHLVALEKKGLITRVRGRARSIVLTGLGKNICLGVV